MENQKIDKQEEKTMKEKYKKDGTKVEIKVASDAKVSRKEKTAPRRIDWVKWD